MTRKLAIVPRRFRLLDAEHRTGIRPLSPACNDSGEPGNSDYAQHHIVPLAQEQALAMEGTARDAPGLLPLPRGALTR